jgi:hypothetical protein
MKMRLELFENHFQYSRSSNIYLIPVTQSEGENFTVRWVTEMHCQCDCITAKEEALLHSK